MMVADRRNGPADIPARHGASVIQTLCTAIQTAAKGSPASFRELPESSVELLTGLRRAFLQQLAQEGDRVNPLEIVHALRAIETLTEGLERRGIRSSVANQADGRTLAVEVAHDMRSPLAAILFLVETISNERSGPLHPAQQRQLGLVYSAAFALSTLTNDLIEFGREGGTLLSGDALPFSIIGVLCGVRDIILPIAEEKCLSVTLTPPDADWRVGYPAALHRVLLNLSTNALKFTDEGCVDVTVRQLSRTAVEFSVSDTGRGMPASALELIGNHESTFHDLTAQRFCSTGLGLSICRNLVAGMGGEMQVETAAATGTRISFTLDLPIAPRV